MSTEHLKFTNWPQIRDALEKAYKTLGLSMVKVDETSSHYDKDHWNVAGLIYTEAEKKFSEICGTCMNCKKDLNYYTVIRCLDCKMVYCEVCAKQHFGEGHEQRARIGR